MLEIEIGQIWLPWKTKSSNILGSSSWFILGLTPSPRIRIQSNKIA